MLEEQVLQKAEMHLRGTLDPTGEYEEVADLLAEFRSGAASYGFQCRTHEGLLDCRAVNLVQFFEWAEKNGEKYPDFRTTAEAYIAEHGYEADCHS